ncbi:hypothetical protein BRADI_4g04860v3 [Brachypodium distachyon]|uniref:Calmodulin-binding protein n=1 Tax=Brachypodium distachyon TaxID=15368 RepID=A0A2K2CKG6_BRADI|nr:hypothetical protein BRADI_4g04860v3 [Brachypodium distachyon]PNT62533.1 hypothetical protein BRADI_4g04860v3 [Brachypodium distachyon]PNT62534.1 hypothetical protein BRADI_4g04860v3 [Brachypodium distachyon]
MSAAAAAAGTSRASGHFPGLFESSACSTPFVSAPSSPARDPSFHIAPPAAGCYFSAPASPARGGAGGGEEEEFDSGSGFGFGFDFASRFPSPAMSSADELFHNGQIRPMRLSSFLLRPQQPLPAPTRDLTEPAAADDERGRFGKSRSAHRRARSLSPFRGPRKVSPARAAPAGDKSPTSASRSSSSSSNASSASSASSSSSRSHRRWGFLKDLMHRNHKSDDGPPAPSLPPMPTAPEKKSPARVVAAAEARRGRRRRSAHERLYEARRAEAEDMRRRTFLPYRQGLLLGCLGLGSRGYGAMHGFAAATAATARSSW